MSGCIFALKIFLLGTLTLACHRLIYWRHENRVTCLSDWVMFTVGLFLMLLGGVFAISLEW